MGVAVAEDAVEDIAAVGAVILVGFITFMSWRLSEQWSDWLLGFALFDVLTLALVLNEWAKTPKKPA